jgi:hypothetical protein
VPGELTLEIGSEIAVPVRIVDRDGNVLAEAGSAVEQKLVFSTEADDRDTAAPRYFLELLRTSELEPERGYGMTISVHGERPLP